MKILGIRNTPYVFFAYNQKSSEGKNENLDFIFEQSPR